MLDKKDSDDSDLDFGDDDDDESDEEYDDGNLKPWQRKAKQTKPTLSRLDRVGESDEEMVDELAGRGGDKPKTAAADATLEDFVKVTIPRRRLARWCNEPFFEPAVKNCFVKLFVGEDDSGKKCYRLCEIVDVKTGGVTYKFPVPNKTDKPVSRLVVRIVPTTRFSNHLSPHHHLQKITSNKLLRLRFGSNEKDFPMYLVSDALPTEDDVTKYASAQKDKRLEVLSKRRANKLRRVQDNLVNNYTYSNEDIERNVKESKKKGKGLANMGLEQTRAKIGVEGAKDMYEEAKRRHEEAKKAHLEFTGPEEEAEELERAVLELAKAEKDAEKNLEEKTEEFRVVMAAVEDRKRRLKQRSNDVNWAKVNQRSKNINQMLDFEGVKSQKPKETSGSQTTSGTPKFNPYARRKVKPKILWEVGQKDEEKEESNENKAGGDERREQAPPSSTEPSGDATPNLVQEQHHQQEDSHQFMIDEEVLAHSSNNTKRVPQWERQNQNGKRVRKGLSLSEYLQRKTAGTL